MDHYHSQQNESQPWWPQDSCNESHYFSTAHTSSHVGDISEPGSPGVKVGMRQSGKMLAKSLDLEQLSVLGDTSAEGGQPQASAPDEARSGLLKGFFFMNNFCLLNNCAAMSFKLLLKQGVSVLVLALFRNAVLLLISLLAAFILQKGCFQKHSTPSSKHPVHSVIPLKLFDAQFLQAQARSLFGTVSFLLFTFNLTLIPMTFIIIIFQTNPLWSAILGFTINRERVSPVEVVAMIASFACVILIAMARSTQTQSSAAEATLDSSAHEHSSPESGLWLGVFLCLCHAWLFSGIGVISRRLQKVHFTELMLHQSTQGVILISLVLLGQALCFETSILGDLTARQVWIMLAGCLCDSLAMISMCIAFQATTTSVVSMVGYLAIVYAIITDLSFFGDSLSLVELIGCAAVVTITLILGYLKSQGLCGTNPKLAAPHNIQDSDFLDSSQLEKFGEESYREPKQAPSALATTRQQETPLIRTH